MVSRVDELLEQLTLDEKAALLAGSDMWHTTGIPRLGIPRLRVTDGPSGARGQSFRGGPTSACFPCGAALAATWNPELVRRVGHALAEEARSKGAQLLLAPTVNLHRTPLGGRNFECYSEDPWLSARTATAFVQGVQSGGVGACLKHFACNDSELERMTISSEVDERPLRELYLRPFEMAVREARPWAVMAAYNRLNGTFASEHATLLDGILRGEWGFEGIVVSDWFATHSTADALAAGLDLEMPGPTRFRGEKLVEAVRKGELPAARLEASARRVLETLERAGVLEARGEPTEHADDKAEHRALAREAARESFVLLQNRGGVLPLDPGRLRRLAVIGPNADVAFIQGGGSAGVTPHYAVSPLEGLRAGLGAGVAIAFERGCANHKGLPVFHGEIRVELYDAPEPEGEPVLVEAAQALEFTWLGRFSAAVDPRCFSARMSARFAPRESGAFTFGLASAGRSRLRIDGEVAIDHWTAPRRGETFFGLGTPEVQVELEMRAGDVREIVVEFAKPAAAEGAPDQGLAGVKLGVAPPLPDDALERAEAAARGADAAVVVVGLNADWESEGADRAGLPLPGDQAELVRRVARANPRTAVVVNAGSPVEMDWLEVAPAVLHVWYPGQELGNALAEVLLGVSSPSGKLPTTFPRRIEDTPAYLDGRGERGRMRYAEGLYAGYRWYDARRIEPLFPFGHGLSYTSFRYGPLQLDRDVLRPRERLEIRLDVTNAGKRSGAEVVQLYVHDVASALARPEQELRDFAKVWLEPGETRTVALALDEAALAYWDPERPGWVAEPGEFELRVGSSSRDLRSRARFRLEPA